MELSYPKKKLKTFLKFLPPPTPPPPPPPPPPPSKKKKKATLYNKAPLGEARCFSNLYY